MDRAGSADVSCGMGLFDVDAPVCAAGSARADGGGSQGGVRHGTLAMRVRDELGEVFSDGAFLDAFGIRGRPGISPGQLAMVTVLQFAENLTDRQAADAVRGRIDWKYLLGLELTDPGLDFTVLSQFRARLVEHDLQPMVLDMRTPAWLWQIPAVETLRRIWVQRYVRDENGRGVIWRDATTHGLPPGRTMIVSPYDTDARHAEKRGHGWSGYKIHISETCDNTPTDSGDAQPPNLITNVVTTHAANSPSDRDMSTRPYNRLVPSRPPTSGRPVTVPVPASKEPSAKP